MSSVPPPRSTLDQILNSPSVNSSIFRPQGVEYGDPNEFISPRAGSIFDQEVGDSRSQSSNHRPEFLSPRPSTRFGEDLRNQRSNYGSEFMPPVSGTIFRQAFGGPRQSNHGPFWAVRAGTRFGQGVNGIRNQRPNNEYEFRAPQPGSTFGQAAEGPRPQCSVHAPEFRAPQPGSTFGQAAERPRPQCSIHPPVQVVNETIERPPIRGRKPRKSHPHKIIQTSVIGQQIRVATYTSRPRCICNVPSLSPRPTSPAPPSPAFLGRPVQAASPAPVAHQAVPAPPAFLTRPVQAASPAPVATLAVPAPPVFLGRPVQTASPAPSAAPVVPAPPAVPARPAPSTTPVPVVPPSVPARPPPPTTPAPAAPPAIPPRPAPAHFQGQTTESSSYQVNRNHLNGSVMTRGAPAAQPQNPPLNTVPFRLSGHVTFLDQTNRVVVGISMDTPEFLHREPSSSEE